MRVISGKFKGKRLAAPEGVDVRPTTDRVKENIFNILASRDAVRDVSVLDLFCGSGALGIEALSLGASSAVFVDKSAESVRFARRNLDNIGMGSSAVVEVYNTGFELALKKLAGRKFGLIFLDPPYFKGLVDTCLGLIEKYGLLTDGGVIVIEHGSRVRPAVDLEKFEVDSRDFGSVSVLFLKSSAVGGQ